MKGVNRFIKIFSVREVIERTILILILYFILDFFNIPTFIIEKYRIIGLIVIGLIMLFIIINKKVLNLLKVNVYNYLDLFLRASLASTSIYILFVKLVDFSDFKFKFGIVIEGILLIIFIIRCISLKKIKKKIAMDDDIINVYDIQMLYENKIDDSNNNFIFLEEKDVSYDLLNRNKIVEDLFNSINFCRNKEKFIISLTGPWGSGKTTILNIVKKKLDKDKFIVIDNFEIWKHNNEKSLIYEIVDEILKRLNIDFSTIEIRRVVNSCISMLSSKTDMNFGFMYSDNKMLEKIKMTIDDYLNKNNKRVVFIIDNFERTNEKNILATLKAISTILNIDRFIYILSYDENEMQEIFKKKLKINYDYMEKIVQLPLSVPAISQDDIQRICTKCLENLLKHYGIEDDEVQQYFPAIRLFNNNIKDLRSFKRKVNSMCNSCFDGNNYLNKADSFLIELINQDNHHLYNEIQKNYQYFVSVDQISVYGYSGETAKSFNEKATKYFDNLFAYDENSKYKEVLSLLFPNVEKYCNSYRSNGCNVEFWNESGYVNTRDNELYHESIIQRRIYNAKFFDLYFTKQKNEFIGIDDNINEFISWNNKKEFIIDDKKSLLALFNKLKEVMCLYAGAGQKVIAETFEVHVNEIQKNKLAILLCLFCMQDYMDDSLIFLRLNAKSRLELICASIIKKLSDSDLDSLTKTIEEDYKDMNFIRGILYWLKPENNSFEDKNEELFNKINESYKKLISNVFEKEVNIYDTNNYSRHNIYCLTDDGRYKNQMKYVNENTIFRFLADMISNSVGRSYGYSLNLDQFNKLTSYDFVDDILNVIDKSQLTEEERLIEEVYQKSKTNEADNLMERNTVYRDKYVDIGKNNYIANDNKATNEMMK